MIFNVKQGVKFDPALFKINTQRLQEFNQGGTQPLTALSASDGDDSVAPAL